MTFSELFPFGLCLLLFIVSIAEANTLAAQFPMANHLVVVIR